MEYLPYECFLATTMLLMATQITSLDLPLVARLACSVSAAADDLTK